MEVFANRRSIWWLVWRLIGLIWLTSCATTGPSDKEHHVTSVPPIHVVAYTDTDEFQSLKLDAYDAEELFHRAAKQLRGGACADAVALYSQLIDEFPDSLLVEPALYNSGLCLDELGKYADAVASYQMLLEEYPLSRDKKDTYFRLAASLEELEAWGEMIRILETLEQDDVSLYALDRVEILTKKGAAYMEMQQLGHAQFALESAIRIYTKDETISATAPDYYYSMAQFKLAEITHANMRAIPLPPDDVLVSSILEKKCQLLLDAQYMYTKVIRIGHPHWSAAAAYRTGALYHHLWKDMLDAPAPTGLSQEEQGIYIEVLRKRIKVLLQKAVKQWKRTMKFSLRLNLDNKWISQTQQDLQQIEELLENERLIGQDLPD